MRVGTGPLSKGILTFDDAVVTDETKKVFYEILFIRIKDKNLAFCVVNFGNSIMWDFQEGFFERKIPGPGCPKF